jgi:CDP-paratose 2-epimerase
MNPSSYVAQDGPLLVTGGAGFIGSTLAISFKRKYPNRTVTALDNLKRRGSELNIKRLKENGVEFIHGDIRNKEDLVFDEQIGLIIECSAEPSVLAGFNNSPGYLLNSNLVGALNCLELARRYSAGFVFLSTSRVYPMSKINKLRYSEDATRFFLLDDQNTPGASHKGISEKFPLEGPRSLYGATKLAAELIACEYADMYGIKMIIDRCGVIAGPWQMGKVDQGVFAHWMAAHYFKKKLQYIGFNGKGKQVRDVLHVDDLFDLIDFQIHNFDSLKGEIFNVGGGIANSFSLLEATHVCEEITGNKICIVGDTIDRFADIKYYVSDCSKIEAAASWSPKRPGKQTLRDIWSWIHENERAVENILGR